MPLTDPQLLSRYVQSRDEAAFTELVARHLPLVRGILWRRTGNKELIDDLAMQVFAVLAQKAGSLQKRSTVAGWIVITARQKAAEAMRNDSTRRKYMDQLADHTAANSTATATSDDSDLKEATLHLDDALADLPDSDREAVLLHYYEDLPYREVGLRLGRKRGRYPQTRQQSHRANGQLSSATRRHAKRRCHRQWPGDRTDYRLSQGCLNHQRRHHFETGSLACCHHACACHPRDRISVQVVRHRSCRRADLRERRLCYRKALRCL